PSIGAAPRHPAQRLDVARRKLDAVRHPLLAVAVVAATAGVGVEQPAMNPGWDDLPGLLVLEPNQTAQAAAVTQILPLAAGHLCERLGLPKGAVGHAVTP